MWSCLYAHGAAHKKENKEYRMRMSHMIAAKNIVAETSDIQLAIHWVAGSEQCFVAGGDSSNETGAAARGRPDLSRVFWRSADQDCG